jgi:hypothetical protein
MSPNHIQIIGNDLWFDGMKVGTLLPSGVPSVDAAVRAYLIDVVTHKSVQRWRP